MQSFPLIRACGLIAALLATAPARADTLLDRARDAVHEAGRSIEQAARDAGRSVSDYLADHPNLNRDIVDFGTSIGLPGFKDARPEAGPSLVVWPLRGFPNAKVLVTARGLPGGTPVTISAGPPRSALEAIIHARTSDRGVLDTEVLIPDWAIAIDRLVFVVETEDGRVRLTSEPLIVEHGASDHGDRIIVTGTLSKEGVECPALRGDDGRLYTLSRHDLGALGPGDRVRVEGTIADVSTCMQGTTITVTSIGPAK